jgi:hypothetical protein
MASSQREIIARKTQADTAVQRAALVLEDLLKEACSELAPFPSFPNAFFTTAIECDPEGIADPERGCVVVAEDGELYELEIGIDHEAVELSGSWDPVTARAETKKKLDLHPRDYLIYAYNGFVAVTDLLLEQQEEAESGS